MSVADIRCLINYIWYYPVHGNAGLSINMTCINIHLNFNNIFLTWWSVCRSKSCRILISGILIFPKHLIFISLSLTVCTCVCVEVDKLGLGVDEPVNFPGKSF